MKWKEYWSVAREPVMATGIILTIIWGIVIVVSFMIGEPIF